MANAGACPPRSGQSRPGGLSYRGHRNRDQEVSPTGRHRLNEKNILKNVVIDNVNDGPGKKTLSTE